MAKSADAFRTISEVADWLGIQAHVLRFWESKFTQVKPIKRAGGRRYYRPADMLLLGGIKRMLHDDGMTIKGVQKVLREEGMNYVASLSAPLDELSQAGFDDETTDAIDMALPKVEEQENVVLPFEATRAASAATADAQPAEATELPASEEIAADATEAPEAQAPQQAAPPLVGVDQAKSDVPPPEESVTKAEPVTNSETTAPSAEPEAAVTASSDNTDKESAEPAAEPPQTRSDAKLPAFLNKPASPSEPQDAAPAAAAEAAPAPAPKPRIVTVDLPISEDSIPATPGLLSAALKAKACTPKAAAELAPLLSQLTALRAAMASGHRPAAKD